MGSALHEVVSDDLSSPISRLTYSLVTLNCLSSGPHSIINIHTCACTLACIHTCVCTLDAHLDAHTHAPTFMAVLYVVPHRYVVPLDQNTLSSTHCLVKSHSLRFELGNVPPLKTGLSNLHMSPPPTSSLSNCLSQHFICACGTISFSK